MKKEKLPAQAKSVKIETVTQKKTGGKQKPKTNFSTEKFVDIENSNPLSNRPDYLNALRHAQEMPKRNLISSLYVEVFQTKKNTFEITVKSTGNKGKHSIKKYLESAVDTQNFINALIDEESMNKIKGYIDEFEKQQQELFEKKSTQKKKNTNKKK